MCSYCHYYKGEMWLYALQVALATDHMEALQSDKGAAVVMSVAVSQGLLMEGRGNVDTYQLGATGSACPQE